MSRKIPTTITEDEFMQGLKKVSNIKLKLAFMLGFYQCMRVSEVMKLRPEDVNLNTGFIHIKQAKGSKDRSVPIMQPVRRGLKHLPIGLSKRSLQRHIKKYWPNLKFHSLRHSGATFYLNEKDIDIRFIQQLLGHSRLDTTQIYTHVAPKQLKNRFDDIW